MNRNIDIILAHFLLGTISEEEKSVLDAWLEENEDNRKVMVELRDNPFSSSEYMKYASIDSEKAWAKFKKDINKKRFNISAVISAAAVALCLVVFSFTAMWYQNYTRVTPPELSSSVVAAIQKSVESGYADNKLNQKDADIEHSSESGNTITAEQIEEYQLDIENIDEIIKNLHVETLRDRESWLKLDDGTIVHLSANSRIIYPEHFQKASLFNSNTKREVIVEGEAYFMVAHDNSRQFVVHTKHGDIVDYGTEFFVSTSDKTTKVALVEGSISFTPQGKSEIMMKPGEEAMVNTQGLLISDKDMEEYRAWNTGMFFFEDETLESVAKVMKRWNAINIVFADDKLRNMHISGSFDRYNKVDDIIDAICDVMGLQWTKKNANTILIGY